jgi:hypothetical protein
MHIWGRLIRKSCATVSLGRAFPSFTYGLEPRVGPGPVDGLVVWGGAGWQPGRGEGGVDAGVVPVQRAAATAGGHQHPGRRQAGLAVGIDSDVSVHSFHEWASKFKGNNATNAKNVIRRKLHTLEEGDVVCLQPILNQPRALQLKK